MTDDKRRAKRTSVALPVLVCLFDNKRKARLGDPLAGLIMDFSPIGAALTVPALLIEGKHLFYTCYENSDIVLELVFEPGESPGKIITVPATPVWFDRELESDEKHFIMGLKFLVSTKSLEIKTLSKIVSKDESMLKTLWKKFF